MIVRELQNLGLLIILLSVINTSSHPYPIQEESYRTHPVHRVALNPRGTEANKICIHWYDYTQQEKLSECDISIREPTSKTSPDWSIGYKLSIHDTGTFHRGPFFWWDGWVNGIYCNDIHLHLKENPPWTDLTLYSGIGFKSCYASTVLININNNPTIYLTGGIMRNQNNEDSFISLVYEFNLKLGQWIMPVMKGNVPARRRDIQAVADDFGSIYVFGGGADKYIGSKNFQVFNDTAILYTVV
ncbi:17415_t:CDS:2 [Funneliformis geosporum]|uniref:17415_t:CDS:1 n=1 Tax=Funneliformis geosporum TaxID=1117311 RepID=A0A9W4SYB8_9GLOM|nr:17415_t:CDS:2 [Funneliformis geosporum]